MLQLAVSIAVVVAGVFLGALADTGEMRLFGWLIAGCGVFGLVTRSLIARRRDDRRPPTRLG